ncbi:4'-phosphopantetheinyl transferase [Microbispora sp. NPDC049125]|uniref:4'-phosphopantetheinyl transferase family protein n=1 Tax=Microbispora sp. NPDC049125 TaxID=3154929 RepID=UPI003465DDE3
MIEEILPANVVASDAFDDPAEARLFPEEEAAVGQAVEKRRKEFTTARFCARRAMTALGHPPTVVPSGQRGEPQWPSGIVGSITHCTGYRAAVLGQETKITTIGIDAEPNDALSNGVLDAVSLPAERAWVRELSRTHPQVSWDRLLFSAKESVYKAWFPIAKRWLDFEDALITADPRRGQFSARLLVTGPRMNGRALTGFTGRWMVRDGLILTAIVVSSTS